MNHEPMTEVLINHCYGGFEFSKEFLATRDAIMVLIKKDNPYMNQEEEEALKDVRHGVATIRAFHLLGSKKSSGFCSELASVSIPAFMVNYFEPEEYDGCESVDFNMMQFWTDLVERKTEPSAIVLEMNRFVECRKNRLQFNVPKKE